MEERFLVYNGFENEIETCFNDLIQRFNFKTQTISNYGLDFVNSRCILNLFYETGLQLWIKIPKYNISQMVPVLCMFRGDEIFEEYRSILSKQMNCDTMRELSKFLIDNFSNELSE